MHERVDIRTFFQLGVPKKFRKRGGYLMSYWFMSPRSQLEKYRYLSSKLHPHPIQTDLVASPAYFRPTQSATLSNSGTA